jgi:manganese/iron transport system ATP-binding protein
MNHKSTEINYVRQEPALLALENVTVTYGRLYALIDITLEIPHGAQVAVVGPNGAGKSTLFKALVGLLPFQGGSIQIHGVPLGDHKDCVAYIPQREEVDWTFPVSVKDVILMGRFFTSGWFRSPKADDYSIIYRSMQQLGISSLAERSINDLSGGQQQRVFLARAMAQEPHILLMDEPFTGIDSSTQHTTLELLESLRAQQVTVLVSTHDLTMASEHFEKVLLLNRRIIAYGSPADVFTSENLERAFGKQVFQIDGTIIVDQCCAPEDE